ncbi:alpha/beta fold hydrolase [Novosphingobium malaysiense]|uniref:alpha/beta fold hydrolase n=1 Tax=Novosphingobium malaysiense TaxID=1348853 RepID=UPI00069089E2|nr:alpha/beta hydrolase [Novosphingobium malaysiense]
MPTLTLPDTTIFHMVSGTGDPPIILVHGGMCDHRDWDRLTPLLAARHRVVTPDLRGHGRSVGNMAGCTIEGWADDLLTLLKALECKRPVLVGHSLASRIVAEVAARAPETIGGVVLLDGSRGHGGNAAPPPDVKPEAMSLDAVIDQTIGPHASSDVRDAVRRRMASASPAVMQACVDAMRQWDMERADTAFTALAGTVPLLAIQSTYHDPATPRRSLTSHDESTPYLDFLRSAVPQLEVRLLADTGHFSMLERPKTVADMIQAFAAKIRETT